MRALVLAFAALAALSFVSLTAPPADAVSICTVGDVYNTGGSHCEGLVCTGWNGQTGWQTCYPDFGPCPEYCPPPQ
jgi:hypothetical protein